MDVCGHSHTVMVNYLMLSGRTIKKVNYTLKLLLDVNQTQF